jgi:hypothetical protein
VKAAGMAYSRDRTIFNEDDFRHHWKESLDGGNAVVIRKPHVTCSFDMGWQQRSSGSKYASQSGHAVLVGC